MNVMIFCSSWIVCSYIPFHWEPYGILSGALWMASSILAVYAIQNIGISVAQGLWSGSTIAVSFIWGAAIFHEQTNSIGLSILALVIIGIGIAGISISGSELMAKVDKEYETLLNETETLQETSSERSPRLKFIIGVSCALGLGITNGSVLAPINGFDAVQQIGFIASFGCGLAIVTPAFALPYFLFQRKWPDIQMEDWVPFRAFISGLMWNIGNFCALYATRFLGFTIGFPLTQTALIVGGLWGIFLFKELTGWKRIGLFALGVTVLIGGAVLLAIYGKKSS